MKTNKELVKVMQDIMQESQLAAAFIMEGLHDFGYEAFCAYNNIDGVLEKITDAVEMAEKIGRLVFYVYDGDFSHGVLHYEISSMYGMQYAEKAVEMGRALATKEMEVMLHDIIKDVLGFDNEPEKVADLINFVFTY